SRLHDIPKWEVVTLRSSKVDVNMQLRRLRNPMTKANPQQEIGIMALVRMLRGGQVTLPAEARRALNLSEGDYLDLEVSAGAVTLKPVTVIDRAGADRQLDRILSRVKYVGPEPAPTEDEVMDLAADEVRTIRTKHAQSRSR